ncbi:hypothetical protein POL68_07065 [Stigmatella sp. ncwal1]|uniref:Dickkopf N-terminal cysteine-rich domain-containing protein n=1 Tax=Stigmatella ashevillensis TaxID=2995309 RepID=A0ABT5D7H6_9BACT|nr:hypothetical protein [Stigmatella ashevillena]MDC0708226.1 hypothetical protein [Stigmatella ashevillena]
MRAHPILLWSALVVGVVGGSLSCDGDSGPGSPDAGPDGGTGDAGDAGPDGGDPSHFTCDVPRQLGCNPNEGCFFYRLEEGPGSQCLAGACDPVLQNCPAGQRCTYLRTAGQTERACVEEGTADEGNPCQLSGPSEGLGTDNCKKGLFCTDTSREDGGTSFQCVRFCHDAAQCGASRQCNEVLWLNGTVELPLVCGSEAKECDLLAQNCESPLGCYPTTGKPLCTSQGGRGEGARCEFSNQCASGSACVRTGEGLTCRPLCRLPNGQPSCAQGSCQPLQGHPDVGACVP